MYLSFVFNGITSQFFLIKIDEEFIMLMSDA